MFVEEDYKKIFLDLGFRELAPIKKDIPAGYYISHGIIANREVVIRILTKKDKQRVLDYKKEMEVSKVLKRGTPKKILSQFACPRKIGENNDFIWTIRNYVPGKAISLYNPNNPSKILMGYDEIDHRFEEDVDLIISGTKENLNFLWSINLPSKSIFFKERFSREIDSEKIKFIELGIGSDLSKQISFYKKNKNQVFLPKNIRASFGDLVPANIIYSSNKKIVFLDFDFFSFDSYLADVSFLWLYLWRYPLWQKKILDSLIITKIDRMFFRVNLMRQILGFYSEYIFDNKQALTKSVREKRNFFPNHIWTKYLIAAGESYQKLIETR